MVIISKQCPSSTSNTWARMSMAQKNMVMSATT